MIKNYIILCVSVLIVRPTAVKVSAWKFLVLIEIMTKHYRWIDFCDTVYIFLTCSCSGTAVPGESVISIAACSSILYDTRPRTSQPAPLHWHQKMMHVANSGTAVVFDTRFLALLNTMSSSYICTIFGLRVLPLPPRCCANFYKSEHNTRKNPRQTANVHQRWPYTVHRPRSVFLLKYRIPRT